MSWAEACNYQGDCRIYAPVGGGNWALAVAEGMEAADIDWVDDPDASVSSRAHFERHLREKWERTQRDGSDG